MLQINKMVLNVSEFVFMSSFANHVHNLISVMQDNKSVNLMEKVEHCSSGTYSESEK